jgi:NCS1 family nucleobase:cation symporter-1
MQVPLALGTQTGGSTIRPGSYNGIYAMKPTWNAISREGQKIYSLILDTLGLYARSVEDLQLLAEVFALKDDDGESKDDLHSSLRQDESPFALHGAKFAFVKTMVWPQVGQGTADAMGQAMLLLQAHGATVEEVTLPSEFGELPKWHRTVLMSEGRVSFLPEYRRAKDLLSPYLIDQVENVAGYSRKEQLEAFDGIASLRPKIDDILGQYAAIVTPSVPDEAPSGIEKTGSAAFNSIWTVCIDGGNCVYLFRLIY